MTQRTEPVSRSALLYLLISLGLTNLLMLLFMPWWVPALGLFCIVWRLLIHSGRVNYPKTWQKSLLAVAAFGGLTVYFGLQPVLDFFLCLLLLSICLRLLELQSKRDANAQVWMSFFVLMTVFIFEQMPLYALLVYGLISLLLAAVIANYSDARTPLAPWRASLLLLLCTLPCWLLLFVAMPRIGPLWHMPLKQQGSAQTGMSDSMAPGDIVNLTKSNQLVLRASFAAELPERHGLYWLAMYLDHFDGSKWSESCPHCYRLTEPRAADKSRPYELILEAHQQHWLFLLQPSALDGERYWLSDSDIYRSAKPLTKRLMLYAYHQPVETTAVVDLSSIQRQRYLQLPADGNPKTRALVSQWRADGYSDQQTVAALLQHYRQSFQYTLQPPALSGDRVDHFLFTTRAGYCEHFASSFVVAMRAAGIPARVAIGYMGGEINQEERLIVVRQHDAHAWAEVWLEGRWQRIDPTAYVAPERIAQDFNRFSALSDPSLFNAAGWNWLNQVRAQKDMLDYWWARWVLGYSNNDQQNWLRGVQAIDWRTSLLTSAGIVLAGFVLWLCWCWHRQRLNREHASNWLYKQILRQYQRLGMPVSTSHSAWQNAQIIEQYPVAGGALFVEQAQRLYHHAYLPAQEKPLPLALLLKLVLCYGLVRTSSAWR